MTIQLTRIGFVARPADLHSRLADLHSRLSGAQTDLKWQIETRIDNVQIGYLNEKLAEGVVVVDGSLHTGIVLAHVRAEISLNQPTKKTQHD